MTAIPDPLQRSAQPGDPRECAHARRFARAAAPSRLLAGGDELPLSLSDALENARAWVIAGFARLDTPFKGGTLVPDGADIR